MLTEDQLHLYVDIELDARSDETAVWAYSVLAAIGQAFGAKKAIDKLLKSMRRGAGRGDSAPMADLRKRLGNLLPVKEIGSAETRQRDAG